MNDGFLDINEGMGEGIHGAGGGISHGEGIEGGSMAGGVTGP